MWQSYLQALFTLSTVLLTVWVVYRARDVNMTAVKLEHALHEEKRQHARFQLLEEDLLAVKKRQDKLAGRFYRDVRDQRPYEPSERDPRTVDFMTGAPDGDTDDAFAAMLAAQQARPQAPKE